MRSLRRLSFVALLLAACTESSAPTTKPSSDAGANEAGSGDGGTGGDDQTSGSSFCSTLDPSPFLCVDFDDGAAPADVFTKVEGVTVEDRGLRAMSDGTTDAYVEHETDPSPQWSVVELGFS